MKLTLPKSLLSLVFLMLVSVAFGQVSIKGQVTDEATGEPLIGVSILVKGTVLGTITDVEGNFSLDIKSPPPVSLIISSVGYERLELDIDQASVSSLKVEMKESMMLGQEVVVSASRVEENILQSPVSIEKMDILAVQNTSSDTYYKAIANLKGVDVATSSINFQIINARGFGSTGNTRFVQLIDGMDTQAPALNFPIGNLNGPSELDVESVELIPGASSALYGPNAFNGILLINSKNPFEYQGLSAFVKTGVNHVGSNADHEPALMKEASLRYAKSFNNKFAFKINGSYSSAEDWHGTSSLDRNAILQPEGLSFNPGSDKPHFHGDEASINLGIFPFSSAWRTLARTNTVGPGVSLDSYRGDLPTHVVSLTPYKEVDLIDYGAENIKANVGLYYRITDQLELSYLYNGGFGTSIYTGAQRYSLSNFGIQQHRAQLRGDNFYLRAYGTFENSGDSYITEFLALKINEKAVNAGLTSYSTLPQSDRYVRFLAPPEPEGRESVTGYLTSYSLAYLQYIATQANGTGLSPGELATLPESQRLQIISEAHNTARAFVDDLFILDPNSQEFNDLKKASVNGVVPEGPKFNDKSAMYQAEGQYDFKNEIDFMELQAGASFRMFALGSNGTIFPDTSGNDITIKEYGAYVQAGKKLTDNFKLSGSVRFDKNENFNGQVNPRLSGVYTLNKNHNFRASFQTGFRNPTTQGQFIDLNIISARLLGGLPEFYETYRLTRTSETNQPLVFTGGSVNDFRNQAFEDGSISEAAIAQLESFTDYQSVKPEKVKSMELGYKSLINNKLMVDAVYFYNIYNDFITQIRLVVAEEFTTNQSLDTDQSPYGYTYNPDATFAGTANYGSILNGSADNSYQIYTNLNETVRTQGAALGLTYSLSRGYTIGGNYSWNQFISGYNDNTLNDFNTPEHKFNIKFGNRKLTDNLGFNITYRWQDAFRWESSFGSGTVPAYSTLDAQVSYRLDPLKSVVKLGGSNVLGDYYIQSIGGPNIGAIYYISVTFDELMN
ncbi:TonB-dependent receptor [Marinoscillum sp.]|uniref:TonB-dependent receptor n=1 Tax=Marinoscillum sp. TaxID=2024838 RepID=UPI003BA8A0C6